MENPERGHQRRTSHGAKRGTMNIIITCDEEGDDDAAEDLGEAVLQGPDVRQYGRCHRHAEEATRVPPAQQDAVDRAVEEADRGECDEHAERAEVDVGLGE